MLPFAYESATVKVVAEREEPPPHIARMRYDLQVVTDEPEARVELLHQREASTGVARRRPSRGANPSLHGSSTMRAA